VCACLLAAGSGRRCPLIRQIRIGENESRPRLAKIDIHSLLYYTSVPPSCVASLRVRSKVGDLCVNFGVTKSCDDGRDGGEAEKQQQQQRRRRNTMTLPNASHAGNLQGFRYACLCFCLALSTTAGSFLQGTHCKRHTKSLHVPRTPHALEMGPRAFRRATYNLHKI